MEPYNERCINLTNPSEDIATEIHPHQKDLFPNGSKELTALNREISD